MIKVMFIICFLFSACAEIVDKPTSVCSPVTLPHLEKVADGIYMGSSLVQTSAMEERRDEVLSIEIQDAELTLTYKDDLGQSIQKTYKYLREYKRGIHD